MNFDLPLEIDDRRVCFCRLNKREQDTELSELPIQEHFVVAWDGENAKNLLRIPMGPKVLQCSEGGGEDLSQLQMFFDWRPAKKCLIVDLNHFKTPDGKRKTGNRKLEGQGAGLQVISRKLQTEGEVMEVNLEEGEGDLQQGELSVIFRVSKKRRVSLKAGSSTRFTDVVEYYTVRILLHLVPDTQIYQVAQDFGSEASQIAYRPMQPGAEVRWLNLVELLKSPTFYNLNDKKNHEFRQFELTNDCLFRSFFFAKKGGDFSQPHLKPSANNPLKILTDKLDARGFTATEEFHWLPNLKLADLVENKGLEIYDLSSGPSGKSQVPDQQEDVVSSPIKQQDQSGAAPEEPPTPEASFAPYFQANLSNTAFRQLLVRSIICQLLHPVFMDIANATNKTELYLIIHLLVPNTYHQRQLYELMDELKKDLERLREKYHEYHIKAIELQSISESDASFCGYANALFGQNKMLSQLSPEGRYLIVDAGKGTLDFSIIQPVDNDLKKYQSIYRSGIEGSGQYITYAIMEAFIKGQLRKDVRPLLQVLRDHVLRTDIKQAMQFFDELDGIKRGNRLIKGQRKIQKNLLDFGPIPNFEDEVLRKLRNFNKDQSLLQDVEGVVARAIHDIVMKVKLEIMELKLRLSKSGYIFDKVIMTGRSFLFEKFRKDFEEAFSELVSPQGGFYYDKLSSKKTCIEGVLTPVCKVNFGANLLGGLIWERREPKTMWRRSEKRVLTITPITKAFFLGTDRSNEYTYRVNDTFRIGRHNYHFHGNPVIADETKFKINLTKQGYVFRADDSTKNHRLEVNRQTDIGTLPALKSMFPQGNISLLLEYYEFDEDKRDWTGADTFYSDKTDEANYKNREFFDDQDVVVKVSHDETLDIFDNINGGVKHAKNRKKNRSSRIDDFENI